MWEVVVADVAAVVAVVVVVFCSWGCQKRNSFYLRQEAGSKQQRKHLKRTHAKQKSVKGKGRGGTESKREREGGEREGQARQGKRELTEGGVGWQNRLRRQV